MNAKAVKNTIQDAIMLTVPASDLVLEDGLLGSVFGFFWNSSNV